MNINARRPGVWTENGAVVSERRFTLVELLVVIAVISILAGLLLPALGRARTQALTVSCTSNQKQLHLYMINYVDEFDDYYPSIYSPGRKWFEAIMPYFNASLPLSNAVLFDYKTMRPHGPFDCPGQNYILKAKWGVDGGEPEGDYSKLGWWQGVSLRTLSSTGWKSGTPSYDLYPRKMGRTFQPSTRAMFSDMEAKTSNGFFEQYRSHIHSGLFFPRHNNGINVVFAAGNAEHLKWQKVPTGKNLDPNKNFFMKGDADNYD